MLVDTHAHLTDPRFAGEIGAVLERARKAGVNVVVTVASNLADSEQTVALAASYPGVFATIGVHPHEASSAGPRWVERLRELATGRVVAIGETGLDFHYDTSPRPVQREVFSRQLELARELDLPVVVHARDADEEVSEIIRSAGWERGVLHCFSSGRALLESALELGWYISFAGMITFTKWESAELLRSVPLERLLVETDSPYLAPVPHRGKRNEPGFVRQVAEKAAFLRGETTETLIAATTANAFAFYGIDLSIVA